MERPSFEHYDADIARSMADAHAVGGGLPGWLGMQVVESGPGLLAVEIEARDELNNPFGSLHGGVVAALVDHVLGTVMYPLIPRGAWAATTEFKLNYLAPVRGGRVRAEARVIALTKRTGVVQVDVTNDGRPVCAAQGTCLIQPPKPSAGPA